MFIGLSLALTQVSGSGEETPPAAADERITEAGDARITEDGDTRITE